MTNTHEFSTPLWVQTPLGDGRAILHIDYGIDHNGILLVQLDTGELKYFDTNDCTGCENHTLHIKKPGRPK